MRNFLLYTNNEKDKTLKEVLNRMLIALQGREFTRAGINVEEEDTDFLILCLTHYST